MATAGSPWARAYWDEVVRPVLDAHRPAVPRAAARLGTGSDVLGLDDLVSRDHDWGLRLQVFVPEADRDDVLAVLDHHVADEFAGLPTRFTLTGQAEPALGIDVAGVGELAARTLGFDPRHGATTLDWLTVTGQAALEITAGAVFEDTSGDLTSLREALAWWPDDVWRHVVACDWQRLDQELPLAGRAGDRGDDLGSRVIVARLVDVAMHLGFALCRRWAPYPKWRGTVFGALPLPDDLGRSLARALEAGGWRDRTAHLAAALEQLAAVQRDVGLPSATPVCVPFWDRPYVHVDPALVPRLLADVTDPVVRDLPAGLGSIEQRTDNVDLLVRPDLRRAAVL